MDNVPDQPPPRPKKLDADFNPDRPATNRFGRRLQRIREEVERNRTVGPKYPTWLLALVLVAIIAFFTLIVIYA
jgi:preprotein translocase subunit SecF